ncbi:MAG: hypothetical protein JWP20_1817 [Roseomonas sp.]|jgi:hypothetical protein|nr:hypothetical protein [Roseomonas sp.]
MTGFIGRWLSDSIRFGLGLMLALAAMQVPALTNAYTAALLQISEDARRDITQRKEVARQYYRWADVTSDSAAIDALRPVEPANAEALAVSVAREQVLRGTHDRLMALPALLRPIQAAWDMLSDGRADKRAVLRTAIDTHAPQIVISMAAAIYGLAGLTLGLLLAQLLLALPRALWHRRGRRPALARPERRTPVLRA